MAPEKKKILKDVISWASVAIAVITFILATGGFVADTKNTAEDVLELQRKVDEHEKWDAQFKSEVMNTLTELKVSAAKTNQSLEDLKTVGKAEIEYHKATLNALKK